MATKIEKYLKLYAKEAEKWIADRGWIKTLNDEFQSFFEKENLEKADWAYFQKLRGNKLIHSFNALQLAGARALSVPNHPIEHYRKVFLYLKYGEDKDYIRFNNLIDRNSAYSLRFFGKSAISELIGQAFPEKYVFYNLRDVAAIRFLDLNIDERKKRFGDLYIEYNELIRQNIEPQYTKIVKTPHDKEIPICLRIDQFFSWLYENHIFNTENLNKNEEVKKPKGKITKIRLISYNQFKNITFDFTYPSTHEKAGKPLEKICFIGQSGTGKTTLLNIFRDLTTGNLQNIRDVSDKNVEISYKLSDEGENRKIEYKTSLRNGNISTDIIAAESKLAKNINEIETEIASEAFPTLMYFPPNIITEITILDEQINHLSKLEIEPTFKDVIIDFSAKENKETIGMIWGNLLKRIEEYKEEQTKQKVQVADAALSGSDDRAKDAKRLYEEWRKTNPNPITDLTDKYLNKFLSKFNLKINAERDSDYHKPLRFEPLYGDKEIEHTDLLSTGSKQIILRTLPFYSLWDSDNVNGLPLNSIILMDEPENSLYPDVQREMIDYFQDLTQNCQFFYATHSPIIAAQFEPCERFILTFEDGHIRVRKGSETAPEGVDSNQILTSEYKTPLLGTKGEEMWQKFLGLSYKIKKELNIDKKQLLIEEYMTIGLNYNFLDNEEN